MAESREPRLIEAVPVTNFAPHIDESRITVRAVKCFAPLCHWCAWSYDVLAKKIIAYRKFRSFIALVNCFPDKPRNVASRKITNVSKANMAYNVVSFSQIWINTEHFRTDICALDDPSFIGLVPNSLASG